MLEERYVYGMILFKQSKIHFEIQLLDQGEWKDDEEIYQNKKILIQSDWNEEYYSER
ncbi:unnamed protein product [Paramecium octaurelia]|uniref:Uncharacterized protein n=1 Tax=Paramecium octaurelia TaxID=43137 RepID=A0A8S1UJA4_PAROT|nr:unnamed protein product [Paramecium octaurelia]